MDDPGRRSAAKSLTRDEGRRIAANIALQSRNGIHPVPSYLGRHFRAAFSFDLTNLFSNSALPPGMSIEKIRAGVALALKQMTDRGWEGDVCYIRPDGVERHLASANYACVVIGEPCSV
jgi:hypothetical protein